MRELGEMPGFLKTGRWGPRVGLNIINTVMINFFCFYNTKTILCSDLPIEKIKAKFGHKYEILTSVKTKDSVDIIVERLKRNYSSFTFTFMYVKTRRPFSEESKRKMSLAKMGKPRDEETKRKISIARKGKGNFAGKNHREESKDLIRQAKYGNDSAKDLVWVHNPRTSKEKRVKTKNDAPPGFRVGRDYYSTEAGLIHFKEVVKSKKKRSTNSPTEKQSMKDPQLY